MTTQDQTDPAQGPLAGLRVLDMSRVLAGPWSGQALADLGAEVIKIERPGSGDDTRGWGPPYLKDQNGQETVEAAYYLSANRGKRSLALDIGQPEGARLARELAAKSDILLENFKVGGLKKYGLDYDSLAAVNPGLIYCSITGFGQTGPYATRPGYDFMIQAMGGLMSITGAPDEVPGGGPVKVGVAVADLMTGMYATVAVLAALEARHRSGRGQYIDLALLDVQAAFLANQNYYYLATGENPPRLGNAHPTIVPYKAFPTQDGWIVLAVGNDGQFRRFCELGGRPELAEDPRYATNRARVENRAALEPMVEAILAQRSTADWVAALEGAGVPAGPINRISDVYADPQIQHRGLRIAAPHPLAGQVEMIGNPIRYSETPVTYQGAPPILGQHSDAVLQEVLGLDAAELSRLRDAGVIG